MLSESESHGSEVPGQKFCQGKEPSQEGRSASDRMLELFFDLYMMPKVHSSECLASYDKASAFQALETAWRKAPGFWQLCSRIAGHERSCGDEELWSRAVALVALTLQALMSKLVLVHPHFGKVSPRPMHLA